MKSEIKAALITGTFGVIASVSSAIIGVNAGKNIEQKNVQNQIEEVADDAIIITGENNITINNISDLAESYLQLLNDYIVLKNKTSLIMIDGDSTATFNNSPIIDYGTNNLNNIQNINNSEENNEE